MHNSPRMNRRRFLGGVVSAAAMVGSRPDLAAEKRPNILFCLADDWGWPHAGAYGDKVVRTPAFDRIAREGALFTAAFCAAPSCTPSRAAMLTGQAPHRLEEGGNLHGFLPQRFAVYPDLLEQAGYPDRVHPERLGAREVSSRRPIPQPGRPRVQRL